MIVGQVLTFLFSSLPPTLNILISFMVKKQLLDWFNGQARLISNRRIYCRISRRKQNRAVRLIGSRLHAKFLIGDGIGTVLQNFCSLKIQIFILSSSGLLENRKTSVTMLVGVLEFPLEFFLFVNYSVKYKICLE